MQFPNSYFEDEVRDGFYVPGVMKRAWAAQMEILADVAEVCKKHDICWYADWGTLLGAVRHKGFIPWDDDLDICMLRDDYMRFIQVARQELAPNYDIMNFHNENYWQMLTRVVNGSCISMDRDWLQKYHGFPFVAGIDIFPLDFLAPDEEEEELRKDVARLVLGCAHNVDWDESLSEETRRELLNIEEVCNVSLDWKQPMKKQLYTLGEQILSLYTREEARDVALMPSWLNAGTHRYSLCLFKQTVMWPFERIEIPIPIGYEEVLQIEYGDYKMIIREDGTHNYPFFQIQEEALIDAIGSSPFRYRLPKDELNRISARIGGEVKRTTNAPREVVLVPYKASMWDSLSAIWKAASEAPDCDVYVVPIPYYDKEPDGTLGEMHYEGDLFPDDVTITYYEDYDFKGRHPDVIFIHNPYDEYHSATSVKPCFYAKELKNYTNQLIYIPWFTLDDIKPEDKRAMQNMQYYVNVPGVIYADRVIVSSESMQKAYIDTLVDFAGEDTRALWLKKIKTML